MICRGGFSWSQMIPTRHCSCTKADPFFFTRLDSDLEHRSTFAVVYAELNFSNTSWNPASGCWTDYGLFLSRHWFTLSSSAINQLSTRFHLDFYLHYDRRLVPWTLKQQRRYRSYHYYLLLSCWHGTGFPWRSVFSQGPLLCPSISCSRQRSFASSWPGALLSRDF